MKKYLKTAIPVVVLIPVLVALISCAGSPDAKTTVRTESTVRSYERFLDDHEVVNADELEKAGIHYQGRNIFVVITLTDSGGDRYPEWAADKLLTTLYGYRAVDQSQVSDDDFFELVLRFSLDEIVEGKYENLAKVRIDERDVRDFVEMQLQGI